MLCTKHTQFVFTRISFKRQSNLVTKIIPFGGGIKISNFNSTELQEIRRLKWNYFSKPERIKIQNNKLFNKSLTEGITLTPYANAVKCPAHCHYCSEDLQKTDQTYPNSSPKNLIKEYETYFTQLESLFKDISKSETKIGLSLSGLEATAEPNWIKRILHLLNKYKIFEEKVIYSNGAGLVKFPEFLKGFKRLELHRDHYEEAVNQLIMRIEKNYEINSNQVLKQTVKQMKEFCADIKAVCILSKMGISSFQDAKEYVRWAYCMGFKGVIFRELSRLNDVEFRGDNKPFNWIKNNRVSVDGLVFGVVPDNVTIGYYYYNENYQGSLFGDGIKDFDVVFEASCYETLDKVVKGDQDILHKLVFHSNGNLTSGWDRDKDIIYKY